jgi:ATP-dependent RNA helicase DeaD
VLDHARRGTLDLSGIQFAVLDEADEMLSMGFLEDVRKILDKTPKERQNLFVSATINESIKSLIRSYLKDPEEIYLSVDGDNVSSILHVLYETSPDYHKARALIDLIDKEKPNSAIIFCNTREDVNTVYTFLDRQGLGVEMISGELPQAKRERVMARVKAGAVQFLVSTDVAARGIDISGLSHVINYALPEDPSVYLHRCGRTGRIGNTGTALTLAGGADFSTRLTLERSHKIPFEIRTLPTPEESKKLQAERVARQLKEAAGSMAYEGLLDAARQLKERPDADVLIAAAIRAFQQWDRQRRNANADESAAPEGGGERQEQERGERRDRDGRDRSRDDRGRDGRSRDDRGRDGRSRDDRGRDGRSRDDRGRDDRSRDRTRDDRKRDDRPVAAAPPREEIPATGTEDEGADTDEIEETDVAAAAGEGEGEARKRKRRRRKKRGNGEAPGAPGAEAEASGAVAAADASAPADAGDDAGDDGDAAEDGGGDGERKKRRRRRRRGGGNGGSGAAEAAGGGEPTGGGDAGGSAE